MTIFEWNGQYDTSFFQKKKSNSEFLTFDAAPQGGLASNTKIYPWAILRDLSQQVLIIK